MPATRNMRVRNPARAKRLASAHATPEPRRRVREALMALGARVRGPREVFLRRSSLARVAKSDIPPKTRRRVSLGGGRPRSSVPAGPRTAASLGTARVARRKRTRSRRSRGARWVWGRCRSERAKTSMVTTARDCATVKSKQLNTLTAKSCHAFSHTRAIQICHRLLFSPLARALRAGHRTVTTSTSSPSSGASRPSSGLSTPASSPGTVPGAAANAAV
jgi:hypothetical protein